jgi:hypothetical protein
MTHALWGEPKSPFCLSDLYCDREYELSARDCKMLLGLVIGAWPAFSPERAEEGSRNEIQQRL